jgi:penicillin-binding protein 1A
MSWSNTNLKSAIDLLKPGFVIVVERVNKDLFALRQIPLINGGIIVINPIDGTVLAMQGGYDFNASKFDRTTQAMRQPGSLSKTFVFLGALEQNVAPNKIFEDGPIEIYQGKNMPIWKPKNYKGDFLGPITMRSGLEKSRNLVTVRIAKLIGLNKVAEIIQRFDIDDNPKQVYSMVLGSLETSLQRMTVAYASFAISGKKVTPHFIELIKDRNGKILYRRDDRQSISYIVDDNHLDSSDIPRIQSSLEDYSMTDSATAYQVTSILTGVVERGTAMKAKKLGKIIAGKTGTSNDSKDTWFIGFTPHIVVGTYVGYDVPRSLGKRASGANVALPIFIDFMEHYYKDIPSLPFPIPNSIQLIRINPNNGKYSNESNSIEEAFKINNLPPSFNDQDNESLDNDRSQGIY